MAELQTTQQRNANQLYDKKKRSRRNRRRRDKRNRNRNRNEVKLEVINNKNQEVMNKRSIKRNKIRSIKKDKILPNEIKSVEKKMDKEKINKEKISKEKINKEKRNKKTKKKSVSGEKKCLSCKPTENKIANTYKKRADWKAERGLNTIFPNDRVPPLSSIKLAHPPKSNQFVKIKLGPKYANRYVLYYASKNSNITKIEAVRDAGTAYSQFENRGVSKTDLNGEATLKMRCPQIYKEEGVSYFSHVHFIISNKEKTAWINELKTQTVVCDVTHKEIYKVVKHNSALVLNALPIKYFIKERIPGSIPLPHDLVLDKLNGVEVKKYIRDMLYHNPKLQKMVADKKMDFMDIPIISYCYDSGCEADNDLQEKLNKIGFKNVKIFSPGIEGWKKVYGIK